MPTFSPDSLLAVRFNNARPNMELVAIVDAAIPVALVSADVLAQDRKRIPLLDEFILRLVSGDVTTEPALTGILGISDRMVKESIADQFSYDYLTYAAPTTQAERQLRLTSRGEQTASELEAVTPVRVDVSLVYDLLLRQPRHNNRNATIPRGQAIENGTLLLPTAGGGPVEVGDISAQDVNTVLKERGNNKREVLQIRGITQSRGLRALPAKILVYADRERVDIQLGVVIDGELSVPHEMALLSRGGAKALGITVDPTPERPALDAELEKSRVPLAEVTKQRAVQAAVQFSTATPKPAPPQFPDPQQDEIRAIGVFEHPDALDEALTYARRRILLISPWIKNRIVNTNFLNKLETRLQRNVRVHIAYGYSDIDTKSDPPAIQKLENLATRHPEKFTFCRLKNTHAKVLVFDDVWITTSFNWLSFEGDRERTYRMEEGTLVRNQQIADTEYSRYLNLIDEQRR